MFKPRRLKKAVPFLLFALWYVCAPFCFAQAQALSYGTWKDYLPDATSILRTPIHRVRINVHLVCNDDGSGNFNEAEGIAYVKRLVKEANYKLAHNKPMTLPLGNTTPVLPTGYQYVLTGEFNQASDEGIYTIKNTQLNRFDGKKHWAMANNELYTKYGRNKESVINVFLMESTDPSNSVIRGISMRSWVKIGDMYRNYKNGRDVWASAGMLNHELGHALGLAHTWNENDVCDDTPLNSNCWNVDENNPSCQHISNNMMDYNVSQDALTPCQIGTINLNFAQENSTRPYLVPTWCNYLPDSVSYIRANETVLWKGAKDLLGDLVLEQNATLVVQSVVSLPTGARIYLRRNAQLIIDGGLITNLCGHQWAGLSAWGFTKRAQERNQNRALQLKNGGKLENIQTPLE